VETGAVWHGSDMPPGGSVLAARRWRVAVPNWVLCCGSLRERERQSS